MSSDYGSSSILINNLVNEYDKSVKTTNKKTLNEKQDIEEKTNKLKDMQVKSIVTTNENYKNKIYKSNLNKNFETFQTKDDFNSFIDGDINNIKNMNWKQMPLSIKIVVCKDYICQDESISNEDKDIYVSKVNSHNINLIVTYDKLKSEIKTIDYPLLDSL
jgi:hypothetical protein